MSDTPFIKFYPGDFLAGTSGLSPAERGVYITLLCLIYEMDGKIARDDARLARRCGAPKATYVRILEELIEQGKITESDGLLSNKRAEKALVDRQNRTRNATHAAQSRWDAQGEKTQENQQADDAGAMPEQCVADASQKPDTREVKRETKVSPKKGVRLDPNWTLPKHWADWASEQGVSEIESRREALRFKDYWIGVAGQKGVKLDWEATWRNWMRKYLDDHRKTAAPEGSKVDRWKKIAGGN